MANFLIGLFIGSFWGFVIACLLRAAASNELMQQGFSLKKDARPLRESERGTVAIKRVV